MPGELLFLKTLRGATTWSGVRRSCGEVAARLALHEGGVLSYNCRAKSIVVLMSLVGRRSIRGKRNGEIGKGGEMEKWYRGVWQALDKHTTSGASPKCRMHSLKSNCSNLSRSCLRIDTAMIKWASMGLEKVSHKGARHFDGFPWFFQQVPTDTENHG